MGKHVGFEMRQRVDLINPFFVPKCLLGTNFIETKASSLAVSISVLIETQDSGHLCQVAPLASGSLNLNSRKLDLETLVSTITPPSEFLLSFCQSSAAFPQAGRKEGASVVWSLEVLLKCAGSSL